MLMVCGLSMSAKALSLAIRYILSFWFGDMGFVVVGYVVWYRGYLLGVRCM